MADDPTEDGYPDSPADELTPEEPAVSLEEADRVIAQEDQPGPPGAGPAEDEPGDELFDAPDVDQLAAIEMGSRGSHPVDAPNFEDNEAEWSKDRG